MKPVPKLYSIVQEKWSANQTSILESMTPPEESWVVVVDNPSGDALDANLTAHLRRGSVRVLSVASLLTWTHMAPNTIPLLVNGQQVLKTENVPSIMNLKKTLATSAEAQFLAAWKHATIGYPPENVVECLWTARVVIPCSNESASKHIYELMSRFLDHGGNAAALPSPADVEHDEERCPCASDEEDDDIDGASSCSSGSSSRSRVGSMAELVGSDVSEAAVED